MFLKRRLVWPLWWYSSSSSSGFCWRLLVVIPATERPFSSNVGCIYCRRRCFLLSSSRQRDQQQQQQAVMETQPSSCTSNNIFEKLRLAIPDDDNDDDDDGRPLVNETLVARLSAAISHRMETSPYFHQKGKDMKGNHNSSSLLLSQQLFRSLLQKDDDQQEQQNEGAAQVQEALHVIQPQIWNIQPPLTVLVWILEKWYQTGKFPLSKEEKKKHMYVVPGATTTITTTTTNVSLLSSSSSAASAEQKRAILQAYQKVRSAIIQQLDHDYDERVECIEDVSSLLDEYIHALLTTLHSTEQGGGIPSWLGHRLTVGTIRDRLCPPVGVLLQSFQQLHLPNRQSVLTVGGRALTKHYARHQQEEDDDEKRPHHPFWPQPVGNCAHKNALAWHVLVHDILNHAVWINVHVVPAGGGEQLPVVEIRQAQGYGARWSADGTVFRGFLEPVSPFYEENNNT